MDIMEAAKRREELGEKLRALAEEAKRVEPLVGLVLLKVYLAMTHADVRTLSAMMAFSSAREK